MPTSEEIASFLAPYLSGKDVDTRLLLASDICELIKQWQHTAPTPLGGIDTYLLPGAEANWQPQQRY